MERLAREAAAGTFLKLATSVRRPGPVDVGNTKGKDIVRIELRTVCSLPLCVWMVKEDLNTICIVDTPGCDMQRTAFPSPSNRSACLQHQLQSK